MYMDEKDEARFLSHITKTKTGCWLWQRYIDHSGYGRFTIKGDRAYAHRISYEHWVNSPIQGEVDHLCRIRSCVNPEHLEDVSHAENLRRAPAQISTINSQKTHCPHGHEYTPENTIFRKNAWGGARRCRQCVYKSNAAWAKANRKPRRKSGIK